MADIQEVFQRIKETKKKQKELAVIYRDSLAASKSWQDTNEEIKRLQAKKRSIESAIKADLTIQLAKLDNLKQDAKGDTQLLSDLALNQFMKGENIKITDEYSNEYEPVFSVKFKKNQEGYAAKE